MKKYRKRIFIAIIVLFAAFLVWQRFANRDDNADREVYVVNKGSVIETVSDSGEIAPVTYANLSFEVPSEITWVGVAVGDTVTEGQVLVKIDRDQLASQIHAAQIDLEKAIAAEELARRAWDEYKPEERYRIKKDVEQARARLNATRSQWQTTELTSPIDGVVTVQDARVGEIASGVVIRVIDPRDMQIEAFLSESDITEIHIGQSAQITFDAFDDTMYTATITQIDPEAVLIQDVTYYRTVLVLDEIDDRVRSGMNVDVDVVINQKDDVLIVPLRFIRSDDTGSYVHIASDDGFAKQYVTRGVEGDDGSVEIIEGVSEGQQIFAIYDDEDE